MWSVQMHHGRQLKRLQPQATRQVPSHLCPHRQLPSSTLKAVLDRDGVTLTRFRHIPRDARVVKQTELIRSEDFLLSGTTAKSRKSRMDRLIRDLEARGRVRRHGGYLWIPDDGSINDRNEYACG